MKLLLIIFTLVFSTTNLHAQAFQFFASSSVAVGTAHFTDAQVTSLKFTGNAAGANKVLTSDNDGFATWQALIPETREDVLATLSQTTLDLATITIPVSGEGVKFFIDGVLKLQTTDYNITSTTQLTFPALAGTEKLTVISGFYSPLGTAGGDLSGTYPNPTVNKASALSNGSAGQLPYQTGANTTAFLPVGTAGWALTGNGAAAPVWTRATSGNVNNTIVQRDAGGNFTANTITGKCTSLSGGASNKVAYQVAAGVTAFTTSPGANVILVSDAGAPTWDSTPNMVGFQTVEPSGYGVFRNGVNIVYYCNGGTQTGILYRGAACTTACTGGTCVDTGIKIP